MTKLFNLAATTAVLFLAEIAPSLALTYPGDYGNGGPGPAPEIGAGFAGLLLAVAATKYFRQRARD